MKTHTSQLKTPVLFLVFNRPDTTKKVFEEIRKAKPRELFIAADGPRNKEEKKVTDKVRKYILDHIDWNCKVKTLFRDKNLGCKYAVSGAIDWFFNNVDKGIILEDDCLPNQSFFKFCEAMLERYKDDERVMHISGTNVEGESKINGDYFLSKTFNVWGWATWRRAWKHYDVEMKDWPRWRLKINFLTRRYPFTNKIRSFRLYELTYRGKIDTWDYQWDFCCKVRKGISVVPSKNLISNLGVGGGTHTKNYQKEKRLKTHDLLVREEMEGKNDSYIENYLKFFKS